jgi:hypothetical protein
MTGRVARSLIRRKGGMMPVSLEYRHHSPGTKKPRTKPGLLIDNS